MSQAGGRRGPRVLRQTALEQGGQRVLVLQSGTGGDRRTGAGAHGGTALHGTGPAPICLHRNRARTAVYLHGRGAVARTGPVLLHRIRSGSGAGGEAVDRATFRGRGGGGGLTDPRFFPRTGSWSWAGGGERGSRSRAGSVLLLSTGSWFWAGFWDRRVRVRLRLRAERVLAGFWICVCGFSPGGGPAASRCLLLDLLRLCGRYMTQNHRAKLTRNPDHKRRGPIRGSRTLNNGALHVPAGA